MGCKIKYFDGKIRDFYIARHGAFLLK